jgi:hypothetical protein
MKTRMIYNIGAFLTLFSFASCQNEDLPTQEIVEAEENGIIEMSADSLVIKYKTQSSPELILADRLIYKNDTYQLDLSWEEASQLGVPKDVYQEFVGNIEKINSTPENY